MFNLYQLVAGAQGGQGLDNLAKQFGLSRDQADRAVQSLLPALSTAFMTKAAQPGGLGDIAGAMTDGDHRQAYADPAAAQDPGVQQKGGDLAGSIFGSNAVLGHVTSTASRYTGIPEGTLQAMLPVVTSLILGGAATAMHQQGMGGMLGQLAQGGLGGMLSQFGGAGGLGGMMGGASQPTGQGGAQAGSQASFGGMLGSIMSSFFGGSGAGAGQTATGGMNQPGDPASGLPPMVQAGMDQLFKMFEPGTAGPAGAQAANPFGNLSEMISGAFARR